jgi:hypothetical protein
MRVANPMTGKIRGECTQKNPRLCKRHGAEYRVRQEMFQQMKEQIERNHFQEVITPDFTASWKTKKEADGTTTVSVFRSGIPSAPKERGVEKDSYNQADAYKPEGRQGRGTGVFASPTLGGVCRWVRGNEMTGVPDVNVREMRVDIDNTYVYSIDQWERASSSMTSDDEYKKYWDSGMTMREYMEKAQADPMAYNPTEWELLVPEEGIRSVKPVGAKRVSERAYEESDSRQVRNILSGKPAHYRTKADIEADRARPIEL